MGYINNQGKYVNEPRSNIKDKKIKKRHTSDMPSASILSFIIAITAVASPFYLYFTDGTLMEFVIVYSILLVSLYLNNFLANKKWMAFALFTILGILYGLKNGGDSIIDGILVGSTIGYMIDKMNQIKI